MNNRLDRILLKIKWIIRIQRRTKKRQGIFLRIILGFYKKISSLFIFFPKYCSFVFCCQQINAFFMFSLNQSSMSDTSQDVLISVLVSTLQYFIIITNNYQIISHSIVPLPINKLNHKQKTTTTDNILIRSIPPLSPKIMATTSQYYSNN